LRPVGEGKLSDEDRARNSMSAVHRAAAGHQLALAGVLSERAPRASPALRSELRSFQHDVTVQRAVEALRAAYTTGRSAFSEHARGGLDDSAETGYLDRPEQSVDNAGSILPCALTLSLSDTRFGAVTGRRKASYAASWSYVPVVLRGEEHVPLRCMDAAELGRGFMWFTRANRRGRRRDPEWDPVWTDDDEDEEPMDFGWAPLPADRDFVVRLVRTEGVTQCQNTWTSMGTMAHRRLRAYDIITDAHFDDPTPIYAPPEGAAAEDVYTDLLTGRRRVAPLRSSRSACATACANSS